MDFLYVFTEGRSEWNDNELRFSLRSLKNVPASRVYIVGDCPAWTQNLIHIPAKDVAGHKLENVLHKLQVFCDYPEVPDEFILMNDDFFILNRLEKIPCWHKGRFSINFRRDYYYHAKKNTLAIFERAGISRPLDFEVHTPMSFRTNWLRFLLKKFEGQFYLFRSVYGNMYEVPAQQVFEDVKIYYGKNLAGISTWPILSIDDETAKSRQFQNFMIENFKEKSVYEK